MFGQTTSPFASPAGTSTPFGGGAQTGQSTFGAPSAFGSTAPAPAAGGFGGFGSPPAPAPAAGGFGGFGAQSSGTTTGGGFGGFSSSAPAPASAFGQTSAPTPFGAPAPAPSGGGLFGGGTTGATSGFSGFGSPAPAPAQSAFGAAPSTTPFGQAPAPAGGGLFSGGTSTGAFGAPAPAPASGFGATTGGFGSTGTSTTGGGLFGSAPAAAAPSTGFGGFGTAPAASAPNMFAAPGAAGKPGTAAVPYAVTSKTDGATMINLQTITAMPAYEAKSPEELRLEDYLAGNKGTMGQAQPAAAPGGFGATPAPVAPAFGQQPAPAPAFGGFASAGSPPAAPAPAFGGFGAASPTPAPATGGFGGFGAAPSAAPKPGGSLFGAPAPAPAGGGLFGSAPAPAPGTSLFGAAPAPAPAGGSLFGAPAPAPTGGGLFGSAPAPAPAGGSLFGATPAPAPAGGSLFGTAPAPSPGTSLFGAPSPAPAPGGSLFGAPTPAPAPGGSLFGASAPAPTGGNLFGAPAPAPGGSLFGSPAPAPGTSLFGAPAPAPAPGGLFGAAPAPAPIGGSLFGSPPPVQAAPAGASVAPPPTADALLAQQLAAVENQKKELALLEAWRGQAPSGSSVIPTSLSEREATGQGAGRMPGENGGDGSNLTSSYAASSGLFLAYQAAPRSAAKIRPRGFAPVKSPSVIGSVRKMGAGSAASLMSPDSYLGSSAKRLVIKPNSLTPKPKMRLLLTDGSNEEAKADSTATTNGVGVDNRAHAQKETPTSTGRDGNVAGTADIGVNTPPTAGFTSPMATSASSGRGMADASPPPPASAASTASSHPSPAKENTPPASSAENSAKQCPGSGRKDKSGGLAYDFYRQVVGSPSENGSTPAGSSNARPSFVPKLTKGGGYQVHPSLEVMASMSEADLAAVSDFEVSRDEFGSIAWEGAVDVRGVDLDSVVTIEARDVAVYDSEEENGTKPPVGSKLNRPAIITMFDIFPKEGGANASDEARSKMEKKIAKSTKKMGAELVSYNSSTGIWKFRVKHFSRYGLSDDDDDSDTEEQEQEAMAVDDTATAGASAQASMDFEGRDRAGWSREVEGSGRSSTGTSRIRAPLDEDEEMSETDAEDSTGALTSEGEGTSSVGGERKEMEATLQAANCAYAMLSSQMMADESDVMGPTGVDGGMGEVEMFPDEGETTSEYCLSRPSRTFEQVPSVIAGGEGISARIARKCGAGQMTSSSTDFGMRMGRSFRVGWRPDGSFVFPRPSNNGGASAMQISQRWPVSGAVKDSLPLLQVHLKNSVNADIDATTECPTYTLPSALESSQSSTGSYYEKLCATLDDYFEAAKKDEDVQVSDPEIPNAVPRAFSLMSTLYGQEDDDSGAVSNERRSEGIKMWLRDAASHDMMEAIKQSEGRGETLQSIFYALSGGNITKASTMAIDQGHLRLATLLSSSDLQSREDMNAQVQQLGAAPSIPLPLRRIYALLGGDHGVEEDLFKLSGRSPSSSSPEPLDWRRRLALRFLFSNDNQSLPSMLEEYQANIQQGLSPEPVPRHASNSASQSQQRSKDECILFQMLQVWANNSRLNMPSQTPLSSLINPLTHTSSEHDFSAAFHLASALSAIGCCLPLTTMDEARLIDSYVHQLLSIGLWEWAVYVCICSCSGSMARAELSELWKKRATDIILRFYPSEESVGGSAIMPQRRAFLQTEVGVPEEWFCLALADKALYVGDAWGYVNSIGPISPEGAINCYEKEILPTMLFDGKSKYEPYIASLLESDNAFGSNSAVQKLVVLSNGVLQLSQQQQQQGFASSNTGIQELQQLASELQQQLLDESASASSSSGAEHKSLRPTSIANIGRPIPLSVFCAEALAWVAFMQLQLAALDSGHSIFDDSGLYGPSENRRLKHASQLSHLTSAVSSGDSIQPFLGSSDFVRGQYGVV